MNYKIGDLIELEIHSLGSTGEGVGNYHGFTIFVEGALPNELIQASISLLKKNYGKAFLKKIIRPSSERISPICPLFGKCGGCQIMHLSYSSQLQAKQKKVIDALQRIGHLKNIHVYPCISSPEQLAYRNKIQIPIVEINGSLTLGFYEKNSHSIVPTSRCFIHCTTGEKIFKHLSKLLMNSSIIPYNSMTGKGELRHLIIKTAVNSNEALVAFVTTGKESKELKYLSEKLCELCPEIKSIFVNINTSMSNTITGPEWISIYGQSHIEETLLNLKFLISPASFFQVNTSQTTNLYETVMEYAEINASSIVLDAYCGVGTLSLIASQRALKVFGIESVPEAIENAKENARLNNIINTEFYCGLSEHLIQNFDKLDIVIINPPRKGCEITMLEALSQIKPQTLVYVSCDPATLARDLAFLHSKGYNIEKVQPFDMFPQTMHVETVVKLSYGN